MTRLTTSPLPLYCCCILTFPSLSLSPSQVVYPPDSPTPLRRTTSVVSPPPPVPMLQDHPDTSASSSPLQPSLPTLSCPGPLAGSSASSGVQTAGEKPQEEGGRGPPGLTSVPHTVRSVGCQTNEDPLFHPMQAGLPAPHTLHPCPVHPEPPPDSEEATEASEGSVLHPHPTHCPYTVTGVLP